MAAAPVPRPLPVSASVALVGAKDRLFYGSIAVALALTVFAGFAPTYYGHLVRSRPMATLTGGPFTALVHVHGALFTAWVTLFIVQTALVAARRVALHRRMGVAGAILAIAMIVAGTLTALASAARGAAPPGAEPVAFLIVPLFDMVLFTGFVTAALVKRRDRETHKRLMLLAYVSILAAATARLPGMLAAGPPAFFGLTLVFVLAGAVYDRVSRGRVHAAYKWGALIVVLSVPLRLALSGTAAWRAFAGFLIRQV